MLRPMRQTVTKVLLDVAHAIGDRYNLVFRGFHAASAALLIVLFTYVARPRDWTGVAALGFAMLVLTGLHTFGGMMREAYPINHFLLIAIYCLAVFAIAQLKRRHHRGRRGMRAVRDRVADARIGSRRARRGDRGLRCRAFAASRAVRSSRWPLSRSGT